MNFTFTTKCKFSFPAASMSDRWLSRKIMRNECGRTSLRCKTWKVLCRCWTKCIWDVHHKAKVDTDTIHMKSELFRWTPINCRDKRVASSNRQPNWSWTNHQMELRHVGRTEKMWTKLREHWKNFKKYESQERRALTIINYLSFFFFFMTQGWFDAKVVDAERKRWSLNL